MAIDDRVKKLLASGSLTGVEAGKLIIQDSWLVDRGEEGFLTERDIQLIKAGLHSQKDIEDYNSYIHTYKLVDYTLKEAHILALWLQRDLLMAIGMLEDYHLEDTLRKVQIWSLPAVVTQKQYDELLAKQKAKQLQEIKNLKDILEERALKIAEPALEQEWQKGDENGDIYSHFIYHLQELHPEAWKECVCQVIDTIRAEGLQPALVAKAGQAKLEKLWQRIRDAREATQQGESWMPGQESPGVLKLKKLHEQESQLIAELHQAGQPAQEQLISQLEALRDGSLDEDGEYKLLEFTLFSVAELYRAGLPEWVEYVDIYIPNMDEETSARPAGMMQSDRIAILQNPGPDDMDERGYYKDSNPLDGLTLLSRQAKQDGLSMPDGYLSSMDKHVKEQLRNFLAMMEMMEAVSDVVGVDFTEDMRDWHDMSRNIIELYNAQTIYLMRGRLSYLGVPELKPIKLDSLKPSKATAGYIRERLALGLGDGWPDIREALLKELEEKEAEDAQAETA